MSFTPTYTYSVDSTGQVWQTNINPDGSFTNTPIAGVPPLTPSSTFYNTTAENIIDAVIQDAQRESTNRTAILDYVNRTCQRILRDTQWVFLRSNIQRFITQPGSTDYFLGSTLPPGGAVPTGLGLSDVWSVWTESVFDVTHGTQLLMNPASANIKSNLSFQDGKSRPGIPRSFKYEITNPNVLSIYPYADNQNTYQPVPLSPVCTTTVQGALAGRMYYVYSTFVDDQGNESSGSVVPTTVFVPAGSTLVAQPPIAEVASAQQVSYSHWNCYVGLTAATAYKQTASPLATSVAFDEPTSGQVITTKLPTVNNLAPLTGYIIEFRYFRQRIAINSLTQILQIPDYYADVVIAGTNYLFNLYMNNKEIGHMEKAGVWKQEFNDGIRQIRKDLNISFRNTDFIGPDKSTQINQAAGNGGGYGFGSI